MNEFTMRVSLEIYQQHHGGQLRLSEEIQLQRPMSLEEAARVLTKFSELAKQVQSGK